MRNTTITIRLSSALVKNIDEAASLTGVTRSHLAATILTVAIRDMVGKGVSDDIITFMIKYKNDIEANGGKYDFDEAIAAYKAIPSRGTGEHLYKGYLETINDVTRKKEKGQE